MCLLRRQCRVQKWINSCCADVRVVCVRAAIIVHRSHVVEGCALVDSVVHPSCSRFDLCRTHRFSVMRHFQRLPRSRRKCPSIPSPWCALQDQRFYSNHFHVFSISSKNLTAYLALPWDLYWKEISVQLCRSRDLQKRSLSLTLNFDPRFIGRIRCLSR